MVSMSERTYQNKQVLELLGEIYKAEISGVNRYLHYSFMIMGYNRIPIQGWFRDNAKEAMEKMFGWSRNLWADSWG